MSPNDAHKINNIDLIKELNEKKDKLFNKINSKRTFLKEKETCLLSPKLIKLGKKTLESNFIKKGKINEKIPIRILKNSSFGYYLIKIAKNYKTKDYILKEGDEYIADSKLLKKINQTTWNAIVSKA